MSEINTQYTAHKYTNEMRSQIFIAEGSGSAMEMGDSRQSETKKHSSR